MYGLLIQAAIEFTKSRFGLEMWEKVRVKAKISHLVISAHKQYNEGIVVRIINTIAQESSNYMIWLSGFFFRLKHFLPIKIQTQMK